MGFLDNYEGNKERTDRWIATFPQGRLESHIVEFDFAKGYVLVQAKAWRNQEEINPAGIDYAHGFLTAYSSKMARWMIEDTCTSALMRVMALVMGGTEKATKEVMALVKTETPAADYDYWTTKHGDVPSYQTREQVDAAGEKAEDSTWIPDALPSCSHGQMVWKQSHDGSPKSWGGYFCTERTKATQCTPRWYVLRSTGKWEPQV
jgi:hypothetical protein